MFLTIRFSSVKVLDSPVFICSRLGEGFCMCDFFFSEQKWEPRIEAVGLFFDIDVFFRAEIVFPGDTK